MATVKQNADGTIVIDGIPVLTDVPVVIPGLIVKNYDGKTGAFLNISKVGKNGDAEPVKSSQLWLIGIGLCLMGILGVLFSINTGETIWGKSVLVSIVSILGLMGIAYLIINHIFSSEMSDARIIKNNQKAVDKYNAKILKK